MRYQTIPLTFFLLSSCTLPKHEEGSQDSSVQTDSAPVALEQVEQYTHIELNREEVVDALAEIWTWPTTKQEQAFRAELKDPDKLEARIREFKKDMCKIDIDLTGEDLSDFRTLLLIRNARDSVKKVKAFHQVEGLSPQEIMFTLRELGYDTDPSLPWFGQNTAEYQRFINDCESIRGAHWVICAETNNLLYYAHFKRNLIYDYIDDLHDSNFTFDHLFQCLHALGHDDLDPDAPLVPDFMNTFFDITHGNSFEQLIRAHKISPILNPVAQIRVLAEVKSAIDAANINSEDIKAHKKRLSWNGHYQADESEAEFISALLCELLDTHKNLPENYLERIVKVVRTPVIE